MGEVVALGARLRQRREELGLTQAQAARQLDVARTAYRLWELEAARPAPDRWRGIATWLGISMTAILLAEELIDEQEAENAQRVAAGAGMTSARWDTESDASAGDYFSQERSLIADQARLGRISATDAAEMRRVLSRVQNATASEAAPRWHSGQFHKRLSLSDIAPALARAALAATVIGIPDDAFADGELLISELVTNSVKHSRSDWVEVAIVLDADTMRIEVSDQDRQSIRPRTRGVDGGWGFPIIGELATRWGVDRKSHGKTIWVEVDVASPS
jgi:transcriptional regulator with XRE-family HTH domain/anti-sigma regulatory factor (Ser/Thr protein kinase)